MSVRVWTFVRCGIGGKPEGVYGENYETAARKRLESLGDSAQFVHDADMPEALRYRGSWGMLALYNPALNIADDNGNIYVAGLDTVFLRDLDRLAGALNEVDADVVGNKCFGDGGFNSMVLRIRHGSPGAVRVWETLVAENFKPRERCEHYFMRRACPSLGTMETGHIESYRGHVGSFRRLDHVPAVPLDDVCALVFHGRPKPHEVATDSKYLLHELVRENWGDYAY
jgi:hypothetical protein